MRGETRETGSRTGTEEGMLGRDEVKGHTGYSSCSDKSSLQPERRQRITERKPWPSGCQEHVAGTP